LEKRSDLGLFRSNIDKLPSVPPPTKYEPPALVHKPLMQAYD